MRSRDDGAAEISVVLRPALEGQGLGRVLMGKLLNYCSDCGVQEFVGHTTLDNRRIIKLARAFGFVDGALRRSRHGWLSFELKPSTAVE